MVNIKCSYGCGRDIEPVWDYQLVKGWARKRQGGGINGLRLRQTLDAWACRFCIEAEVRGVAAGQQSLGVG